MELCYLLRCCGRDSERKPPIRLSPSGSLLEEQEEEEGRRGSGPCSPAAGSAQESSSPFDRKSAGWERKKGEERKERCESHEADFSSAERRRAGMHV